MSHIVTTWAEFDTQEDAEAHAKKLLDSSPPETAISVQYHEPYDPVVEDQKEAARAEALNPTPGKEVGAPEPVIAEEESFN